MYQHDPGHSGYASDEKELNSGNVGSLLNVWKSNVGATVGSAVTVVGNRLYFGDWNGFLWALNTEDGSVAWKQFVGKAPDPQDVTCGPGIGVDSQPVLANGLLYVGGGDSAVYALDQNTGEVKWRTPLADPQTGSYLWSSVMLANNSLYIGIASYGDCPLIRGGLARIPLNTPNAPIIQYLVPEEGEGGSVWSTPAIDVDAGIVYVTTGNADIQDAASGNYGSAMVALDATTLQIRSSFFLPLLATDADPDWGSSPTLFSVNNVPYSAATSKTGYLWVVRRPDLPSAGDSSWNLKIATDCVAPQEGCGSIAGPAYDGRLLYVAGGQTDAYGSKNGNVFGIDPITRSVVWQHSLDKTILAPVTVVPGVLFVSTLQGVFGLDTRDGTELWNDGTGRPSYSQPVVSNGVLYLTYAGGNVAAYSLPTLAEGMQPDVLASPAQFSFTYTMGGIAPAEQSLSIFSQAPGVAFSIEPDANWVALSALTGITTAQLAIAPQLASVGPGVSNSTLKVNAPDSQNGGVNVGVSIAVNPAPPELLAADVVSAASGTALFAPGSLFSIYLPGIAGTETGARSVPLPISLGGIRVKVNGQSVPLFYVGPNQINGQIPFDTPVGATNLLIDSGGVKTQTVNIQVQNSAPSIFLDANKHALAQNSDYSINNPSGPAKPGDFIILYFTGQGPVDSTLHNGTPVAYDYAHKAVLNTTASIGGKPAQVYFSGVAPGFVGLGQANLQIPDLPPGDYPVTIQIGGNISNSALISVGVAK